MQQIIIKFLTIKIVQNFENAKAQFGDNTLKKTQVYAWHKQFLEEREVKNEGHRHRLSAGKVFATVFFYFEEVLYIEEYKAMRISAD